MTEKNNHIVNQLPKDWKWVKLGEVCKKVEAVKRKEKKDDDEFFYLDIGGIDNTTNKIVGHKNYKWKEAPSRAQQIIYENDILFSTVRTYMKNIAVVENKIYNGQIASSGFCVLRSDETLVKPKFIFYYTVSQQFIQPLNELQTGSSYPAVRDKDVFIQPFPLPPKPTQQAIVSKIEELFSELDKGIEQLKTAQQQLKTYRQSILKWAFEGKLTNNNVKDGELPEGWKTEKLGDMCDKIQDGSHFSPQVQYDEPGEDRFKYITAKNIRNDYMDFRKVTYVDKEFHDSIYGRCNPEFGDVLLTKDGINTGEVTLNTLKEPFSLLSSVCIFKTKKKELRSDFLKYFIQSPLGSKAILDSMTGTAIKRIILRKIKDSQITLPNVIDQNKIVQEIENRLSVADKMEESITQSLQQAEALRQSILKKAFEGKLVKDLPQQQAKIIPLERKVLAGWIIYMKHEEYNFGLTMFQKIFCIVEHEIQPEYEMWYGQHRAGPYDREFTHAFRNEMIEKGWFTEETKHKLTKFIPAENVGKLIKQFPACYRNKNDKIKFVLNVMKDKTLDEAELIATVYAVWNNRLIKKETITEDDLAKDVLNWSVEKQKYSEPQIKAMYNWMHEVKLMPKGFGKIINLESK